MFTIIKYLKPIYNWLEKVIKTILKSKEKANLVIVEILIVILLRLWIGNLNTWNVISICEYEKQKCDYMRLCCYSEEITVKLQPSLTAIKHNKQRKPVPHPTQTVEALQVP